MFVNMCQLVKLGLVLPVLNAMAKRQFVFFKKTKNLRNIILESKLVRFALFAIHRDIYISNDRILKTFANCGIAGRLKLLH